MPGKTLSRTPENRTHDSPAWGRYEMESES